MRREWPRFGYGWESTGWSQTIRGRGALPAGRSFLARTETRDPASVVLQPRRPRAVNGRRRGSNPKRVKARWSTGTQTEGDAAYVTASAIAANWHRKAAMVNAWNNSWNPNQPWWKLGFLRA